MKFAEEVIYLCDSVDHDGVDGKVQQPLVLWVEPELNQVRDLNRSRLQLNVEALRDVEDSVGPILMLLVASVAAADKRFA